MNGALVAEKSEKSMSYTPKVIGMYTVEVTVTDSDGETASGKMLINVSVVEPTEKPTEKPARGADGKAHGEAYGKANGKTDGKTVRRTDKSDPVGAGRSRDRAGNGSTGYSRARTGLNIKHK